MEVKLTAHDISAELALAQGIVDKKTTIPVLGHVRMEAAGGELKLAVSDLEMSLRAACRATVVAEGAATVPLQWLHDYLRLLPPDCEVSISTSADDIVEVARGTARSRLRGGDAKKFPDLPSLPEAAVGLPLGVLASSIRKTLISVSADSGSYSYQGGCLLLLAQNSLGMVSTDGHRLSLYSEQANLAGLPEECRCLIPRKAMANLEKVLGVAEVPEGEDGIVDFSQDGNHLFFRSGRRLVTCQKMTATFPEYTRVLPNESEMAISREFATEDLKSTLRRVDQFAPQDSHAVQFVLEDGELRVTAKTALSGESEASMPMEYEGERFQVGFSARSVLDFLGVCDSENVTVALKDESSVAQLSVPGLAEGRQHRYVIMPIRT